MAVRYAFSVGVDRAVPAREISNGSWLVIGTETPVLDLRPLPVRKPEPSLRERSNGWLDVLLVLLLLVAVVVWGRVQGA